MCALLAILLEWLSEGVFRLTDVETQMGGAIAKYARKMAVGGSITIHSRKNSRLWDKATYCVQWLQERAAKGIRARW